jgi:DNA polymerase-3 subunit delta'
VAFRDIIGQEAAIETVREAISQDRMAHALLLTGPAGVGKLALAQAIAQYVNCLSPEAGDSCGRCSSCLKISKAVHPDLRYVLPIISKTEGGKRYLTEDYFPQFREALVKDPYVSFGDWQRSLGGDNKQLFISVHEVRALKRGIYLKAFEARYKVVIVWNAELIRVEGANAFLKLLEEPPDRTLILMTCSDASQLLPTINSRCQRLALRRLPPDAISHYLQRVHGLDQAHAHELASISEGSLGNAKEFLTDSSQALSGLYSEWLRAIYLGDYQKIQDQIEQVYKESKEFQKLFLVVGVKKMRDSLLYQLGASQLALATEQEQAFQQNFSKLVDARKVERMTDLMEQARHHLAGNVSPQMTLMALSLRMHSILRS